MSFQDYCQAGSDDLNCYEFSGGFSCFEPPNHDGLHYSEVEVIIKNETTTQVIVWGTIDKFPESFILNKNIIKKTKE